MSTDTLPDGSHLVATRLSRFGEKDKDGNDGWIVLFRWIIRGGTWRRAEKPSLTESDRTFLMFADLINLDQYSRAFDLASEYVYRSKEWSTRVEDSDEIRFIVRPEDVK